MIALIVNVISCGPNPGVRGYALEIVKPARSRGTTTIASRPLGAATLAASNTRFGAVMQAASARHRMKAAPGGNMIRALISDLPRRQFILKVRSDGIYRHSAAAPG